MPAHDLHAGDRLALLDAAVGGIRPGVVLAGYLLVEKLQEPRVAKLKGLGGDLVDEILVDILRAKRLERLGADGRELVVEAVIVGPRRVPPPFEVEVVDRLATHRRVGHEGPIVDIVVEVLREGTLTADRDGPELGEHPLEHIRVGFLRDVLLEPPLVEGTESVGVLGVLATPGVVVGLELGGQLKAGHLSLGLLVGLDEVGGGVGGDLTPLDRLIVARLVVLVEGGLAPHRVELVGLGLALLYEAREVPVQAGEAGCQSPER